MIRFLLTGIQMIGYLMDSNYGVKICLKKLFKSG